MTENNQNSENQEKVPIPLEELIRNRRQKLGNLREKGINPYPYRFDRTHLMGEAAARFDQLSAENTVVRLAGRVMLKRKMGKAMFADIHDMTGKMQIYAKIDNIGKDAFKLFEKTDLGDIIGAEGTLFLTKTGEKTLMVSRFEILCKAVMPLPDKHSGLIDKEQRYRRRYVDLIVNPEVRDTFIKRHTIIKSIRNFLNECGFIEVETPILQPLYGGASARPFKTFHNAQHVDLFLRIADELYLKRLIVGGFDKVWEFCKDFRNEGMDRLHNPEFSMVELYWAYADYRDVMKLFQDLLRRVVYDLHGNYKISYEDKELDFEPDFKVISMIDSIREAAGINLMDYDFPEAKLKAREFGIEPDGLFNWGKVVEAFFEAKVEPNLAQPTFITDFPVEISPLAKIHRDNPRLTERFECFIGGLECGNAFSELNDPDDQEKRFREQVKAGRAGDEEAHQFDEDYIRALQYGMPPTGGLGFGIDRLVMILTNQHSIRDVILFPQMKPERDE